MTIISAAIVSRSGKVLLARQFADISRVRIEGLLSAFPKLCSGHHSHCTFIDSASIRYVYQPIEELYLVLVTTRNSNIVEDLATLRLLGRLVSEHVQTPTEDLIMQNCFDILFAFDEVVTAGSRENVTLEQVMTILEMQSNEEEKVMAEKKAAMAQAKREARRRATEIKQRKMDQGFGLVADDDSVGTGGARYGGTDGNSETNAAASSSTSSAPVPRYVEHAEDLSAQQRSQQRVMASAGMTGGMALSSRTQHTTSEAARAAMRESGGASGPQAQQPEHARQLLSTPPLASATASDPVNLKISELISASMNPEGGLVSLDIHGDLFVQVTDAECANLRIGLTPPNSDFTVKCHPHINRTLFQSNAVLASHDSRPFPTHTCLCIVRWQANHNLLRLTKLPLSINCWPAESSATIEYDREDPQLTLSSVLLVVPIARGVLVRVNHVTGGTVTMLNDELHWELPEISTHNATGSLDLAIGGECSVELMEQCFFPTRVSFAVDQSLCGIQVREVLRGDDRVTPIPHSTEMIVRSDEYVLCSNRR